MATGTPALGARRAVKVLGVIEFHVEILFESIGKSFARRIIAIHVLMTDRAHWDIRRCELRQVTSRARFVTWETRSRGIVSAAMTIVAAKGSVLRTCVQEF